jgi:nucleotide-binding universal stress UspA family protein
MFTHLLVPLDGSRRAERALPVAALIARTSGARVTLLHVEPYPTLGIAPFGEAIPSQGWLKDMQRQSEGYLAEAAGQPMLSGLDVETTIEVGTPAQLIIEAAERRRVDLIVLCSHGRGTLARWALGSVAGHVARHSSVPTLVLRQPKPDDASNIASNRDALSGEAGQEQPGSDAVERVLVALDGSTMAEAALAPAAQIAVALAQAARPALQLVVVLLPFETEREYMPDAFALDGATGYLTRTAVRMLKDYPALSVSWSVASEIDVAEALLQVARTGKAQEGSGVHGPSDLIAMTTRGRTGLARWAMGSIAERVLHATSLPLLVVPSPTEEDL